MSDAHAQAIRLMNDILRQTGGGGLVLLSPGVASLGKAFVGETLAAVAQFDGFDDGNDPYREHDFGSVDAAGHRILFKIDYYDKALQGASPNPADAAVTTRVLTIMTAEEY